MFEVGKRYQGTVTGRVVEAIHVGRKKAFVRTVSVGDSNHVVGDEFVIDIELFGDHWKPYTPPVGRTEEVFVKWHPVTGFYVVRDAPCGYGTIPVGKVRFTHTEGVGLTVDVLE